MHIKPVLTKFVLAASLGASLVMGAGRAQAQDKGTLTPRALPPLADPDSPATPAKELFLSLIHI